MARWLIANEEDAGDASSSESGESEAENAEEVEVEDDIVDDDIDQEAQPSSSNLARSKQKITLKLGSQQDICHVRKTVWQAFKTPWQPKNA